MNTFFGHRQLSALGDLNRLLGLVARVLLDILDLLDNVVALEDLAEDNVLAVQPATSTSRQLRAQGALWAGIHAYPVMAVVMKNCEPLVSFPALAMDRRPFLVCLSLKFSSGKRSP